jgi:hypothetical protein
MNKGQTQQKYWEAHLVYCKEQLAKAEDFASLRALAIEALYALSRVLGLEGVSPYPDFK